MRPFFNRAIGNYFGRLPLYKRTLLIPPLAGGQIAPCEISRGSGEFLTGESHRGHLGRNERATADKFVGIQRDCAPVSMRASRLGRTGRPIPSAIGNQNGLGLTVGLASGDGLTVGLAIGDGLTTGVASGLGVASGDGLAFGLGAISGEALNVGSGEGLAALHDSRQPS